MITKREIKFCDNRTVKPHLLKGMDDADWELIQLLSDDPEIILCDEIERQLGELIELRSPSTEFSDKMLIDAIASHVDEYLTRYGTWVYYPWLRKLIRLLPEDEFVECRINRNKYKITDDEQRELSTKRVGVVGLSVGQSVSITMSMERSFGELRIADFDSLELTNLNRIRTGVQNLGLPKTTIVAREIAEIDPFLKVTIFKEGLTEDNIDDFLLEGGQLDVLVDECDGLYMKYLLRVKSRELGIPVIMDTSDNGLVDIERYDLDKSYPLLHGKLEDVEPNSLGIFHFFDRSELSNGLVDSLDLIGTKLKTWPQLFGEIITGAGILAKVSKDILLNRRKVNSGRFNYGKRNTSTLSQH